MMGFDWVAEFDRKYRGFQDAGWTMEPDAEASPPAFTG